MEKTAKPRVQMNIENAARQAGLGQDIASSAKFWLADQMMAHEHAKLSEGGHTNTNVPLRRVFVDLPVSVRDQSDRRRGFLERLINSPVLDLSDPEVFQPGQGNNSGPYKSRATAATLAKRAQMRHRELTGWGALLLVGGPGQGKSTLGQLACQLHRAFLLQPYRSELAVGQAEVVRSFAEASGPADSRAALPIPPSALIPIQISLPDFVAWATKSSPDSDSNMPILLRYIEQLPSASRLSFTSRSLLALCKQLGCLVVLDGFDEVGAAKDRTFIVHAATELIMAFRQQSVGAQFLITTRPQGYSGEMGRLGLRLQEQTLLPLEKNEALRYAEKLIQAKIDGLDKRKVMFGRVKEAANEPATQRLLITPLQVTILTALIQHMGRAPRERWNLFERYFSYTYVREIERGSYASALLSDHRSHVEQIHARIALILQVESEQQGGAAGITKARLEEVIATVLTEEEIPTKRRNELVAEISKAAEERLVFLVEPEPGKFGFEIRSLQEFMAAKALTTGRDSAVESRIRQISKAAMFRNTTLFCASRFFSEASPLRDFFIEDVCNSLDDAQFDAASSAIRAGGLLALETLEEGAVLTQPKRARLLMERATGLLETPPSLEHVRLSQAANGDTAEILELRIRQHFATPLAKRRFNDRSVWISVLEAIAKGEGWAEEIARSNSEKLTFDAEFFEILATCNLQISRWLIEQIEKQPFEAAIYFFAFQWRVTADAKETWLIYLEGIFGSDQFSRRRRGYPYINTIAPIPAIETPGYALPKLWEGALELAIYERNPNSSALANALRKVTQVQLLDDWAPLIQRLSWPLAICLSHYESKAEIEEAADAFDAGSFGDVGVWQEWEKNWNERTFDPVATISSCLSGPFDPSFRSKTPPFSAVATWLLIDCAKTSKIGRLIYETASAAYEKTGRRGDKYRLAEICLGCVPILPTRFSRTTFKLYEWISLIPDAASYLALQPRSLKLNEWQKALSFAGTDFNAFWMTSHTVGRAVLDSHYHPKVVRLFISTINFYSQHFFAREDLPIDNIDEVGRDIIEAGRWNQSESIGADCALIALLTAELAENLDELLVQRIKVQARVDASYWTFLVNALAVSRLPGKRSLALMISFYRELDRNSLAAISAMRFIKSQLQKTVSNLASPHIWDRLALPLPRPRGIEDDQTNETGVISPVLIKSLQLKDVGGIKNLKIECNLPSAGGQWIVILGPNGTGKSTILKSLALGLRNVRDAAIWPKGTFSNNWIRLPQDNESAIADASIEIQLGGGSVYETIIRSDDSLATTFNQVPEQQKPRVFPVYAYGCRRGSALSGGSRAASVVEGDGPEIATLFDSDAYLVHAETWLVKLEGDSARNKTSKTTLLAIFSALKALLDLSQIEVRDQRVWVKYADSPNLPLNAMSDGYLTSAGWFLDLIFRWLSTAAESHMQIDQNFLEKMTGVVLIDEIDLHLHPRWQVDVIARTRKLLPNMSFIVSTHNPLTLVGAAADEIQILERDNGNLKVSVGLESPALLSGGQLYRRYFGIEDIYPSDTGRDVQRYGFLAGMVSRTDAENLEMKRLHKSLSTAGYLAEEFLNTPANPLDLIS